MALLILFLCHLLHSANAEGWHHLLAAPPGHSKWHVTSEPSDVKIHFAGTINPPTLTLNGQPVDLGPIEAPKKPAGELLINGAPTATQGSHGRFFFSASAEDLRAGMLTIVLRPNAGAPVGKSVRLGTSFLDVPHRFDEVRADSPDGSFLWHAHGDLPAGASLEVRPPAILERSGSKWDISLPVTSGKSYLYGTFRDPQGSRALALPIEAIREPFDSSRRYLSVSPAPGRDGVWEVSGSELVLEGKAPPGSAVRWQADTIPVDPDGKFRVRLRAESKEVVAKLDTFEIPVRFAAYQWHWREPPARGAGDIYVEAHVQHFAALYLGGMDTPLSSGSVRLKNRDYNPSPAIAVGWYVAPEWQLSLGYKDLASGDTERTGSIGVSYEKGFFIWAGAQWAITPLLEIGGGLVFLSAKLRSVNYFGGGAVDSLNHYNYYVAPFGSAQLKLALSRGFEFTPRLLVVPGPLTLIRGRSGSHLSLLLLEPLSFRMYF